ncbi:DsbA family protein [Pseudomonadota bacterium]
MLLLAAMMFMPSAPTRAEGISSEQADAILKELKSIRKLLERVEKQGLARAPVQRPKAVAVQVSTKGRPVLGSPDAPITLVEFTDYQCPYCSRFSKTTLPQIRKQYIDTGKVRLVVKDLPLAFHVNARRAAEAAHCAGDQGQYWSMHDVLYQNTKQLGDADLYTYAEQISLDVDAFRQCLDSDRYVAAIDKDLAEARDVGITGTPTFVIGRTSDDVINGTILRGAQPFVAFEQRIKLLLEKTKAQAGS